MHVFKLQEMNLHKDWYFLHIQLELGESKRIHQELHVPAGLSTCTHKTSIPKCQNDGNLPSNPIPEPPPTSVSPPWSSHPPWPLACPVEYPSLESPLWFDWSWPEPTFFPDSSRNRVSFNTPLSSCNSSQPQQSHEAVSIHTGTNWIQRPMISKRSGPWPTAAWPSAVSLPTLSWSKTSKYNWSPRRVTEVKGKLCFMARFRCVSLSLLTCFSDSQLWTCPKFYGRTAKSNLYCICSLFFIVTHCQSHLSINWWWICIPTENGCKQAFRLDLEKL